MVLARVFKLGERMVNTAVGTAYGAVAGVADIARAAAAPSRVTADEVLQDADCLRPWWHWCLSAEGRMLAAERAAAAFGDVTRSTIDSGAP